MIRLVAIFQFSRPSFLFLRRRPTFSASSTLATNSYYSSSSNNNNTCNPEWRKKQLDKLEKKFDSPNIINSDEELQPMWKEMESRVTKRKPFTKQEAGNKIGRRNVKKTDEEAWLQAGLYHDSGDGEGGEEADHESETKRDSKGSK